MQFLYLCEKCVRRESSSVVSVSLPFSCFLSNHHPHFFCCFYGLEVPSELSIPKNHFILDFSCLPPDVVSTFFSKCCWPRVCKFLSFPKFLSIQVLFVPHKASQCHASSESLLVHLLLACPFIAAFKPSQSSSASLQSLVIPIPGSEESPSE